MKKLYTIALLLTITLTTQAQLNGSGYYRVHNYENPGDYISLANDKFNYCTIISSAGGGLRKFLFDKTNAVNRAMTAALGYLQTDIHLVDDANCIDPSTVIYAKNSSGNNYDLIGQGISLLSLTTGSYPGTTELLFEDIYVLLTNVSGSLYTARVTLKASNYSSANLGNRYFIDNSGSFNISTSSSANNAKWYIDPVTYFNVKADVKFGDKYYTTMYVPFAFTLSDNVLKAYVVKSIGTDGAIEIEKVAENGETVPAGTPVLLECSSNVASKCKLIPVYEPLCSELKYHNTTSDQAAPTATTATNYTGTNILKGTYFCNQDGTKYYDTTAGTNKGSFNANNYTANTNPQKYVLGITALGTLGFIKATGTAMPANKAWLEYTGTANLVLPFFIPGDVTSNGVVDVADVTAMVNIILGKDDPTYDYEAAELDGNDGITVGDLTVLVNIILNN